MKRINVDTVVCVCGFFFVCLLCFEMCHYIIYAIHFQTVKQFGGIDILVSNAAANPYFGSMLGVSMFSNI
jgi:hypothetical protein